MKWKQCVYVIGGNNSINLRDIFTCVKFSTYSEQVWSHRLRIWLDKFCLNSWNHISEDAILSFHKTPDISYASLSIVLWRLLWLEVRRFKLRLFYVWRLLWLEVRRFKWRLFYVWRLLWLEVRRFKWRLFYVWRLLWLEVRRFKWRLFYVWRLLWLEVRRFKLRLFYVWRLLSLEVRRFKWHVYLLGWHENIKVMTNWFHWMWWNDDMPLDLFLLLETFTYIVIS